MTRISDASNRPINALPQPTVETKTPVRSAAALDALQPMAQQPTGATGSAATALASPPSVAPTTLGGELVAGARSFAAQLQSLGAEPVSNDDLIAQFLRLQILDMSTNQETQRSVFKAQGNLTGAAFKLEQRLRPLYNNVGNIAAQGQQLENQARSEANKGNYEAAYELGSQASEKYNQADSVTYAYLDAAMATQEATSAGRDHRVTDSSSRDQQELMKGISKVLHGKSKDSAREGRIAVQRQRNETAKLVLELVDRYSKTGAAKRGQHLA